MHTYEPMLNLKPIDEVLGVWPHAKLAPSIYRSANANERTNRSVPPGLGTATSIDSPRGADHKSSIGSLVHKSTPGPFRVNVEWD